MAQADTILAQVKSAAPTSNLDTILLKAINVGLAADATTFQNTLSEITYVPDPGIVSLSSDLESDTIEVGDTFNVVATITGTEYDDVQWDSDDTNVLTISDGTEDNEKIITAVGEGEATITCTVYNDSEVTSTDSITVTVEAAGGGGE